MKKNRFLKTIIVISLEVLIVMILITGFVNWFKVNNKETPIFTIGINIGENGQGTYYGLGYSIEIEGHINKYTKEYENTSAKYYILGFLIDSFDFTI